MPMPAEIALLEPGDAGELAALLARQRPAYLRHFQPFAFDEGTLARQLRAARDDRFWALRCDGALAGFFMLRGFDAGYARPAFGVFVAEEFAGRGLARRALAAALAWCRARGGISAVMLKVHPQNARARAIYEDAGFRPAGPCPATAQEMMELRLAAADHAPAC